MRRLKTAGRHRGATTVVAAATLAGLALSGTQVATAAVGTTSSHLPTGAISRQRTAPSRFVTPRPVVVTTSTGHRLKLRIYGDFSPSTQTSDITVDLAKPDGSESHSWVFDTKTHVAANISARGVGTLKLTSKQMKLGAVALRVRATGPMTDLNCGSIRGHQRRISISGSIAFNTRSKGAHRWGEIGRPGHPFQVKTRGRYDTIGGCALTKNPPCQDGIDWDVNGWSNGFYTQIDVDAHTKHPRSTGYRLTTYSGQGALVERFDRGRASAKVPKLTIGAADHGTLKVYSGGGAGTIQSSSLTQVDLACGSAGRKLHTDIWSSGHFTNAMQPVRIPMQAFGALQLNSKANAGFSQQTVVP